MKKIFLMLLALVATMSINAQVVKIYKGDQLVAKYLVPNGGKVVFEKAPPITGSVYAKDPDCEIGWVQLWFDGPKFAVCNIGAENNKPEDYGGYYTWGGTYKNGTGIPWQDDHNTGSVDLKGEYDTATYLWGDNWRMPTKEEFDALWNNENCTCTWTTQNGVNGLLCTGKAGTAFASNSIFLPAASYCYDSGGNGQGNYGCYWSSTLRDSDNAYFLYFRSDDQYVRNNNRHYGDAVRAVLNENQ